MAREDDGDDTRAAIDITLRHDERRAGIIRLCPAQSMHVAARPLHLMSPAGARISGTRPGQIRRRKAAPGKILISRHNMSGAPPRALIIHHHRRSISIYDDEGRHLIR